ncbi:hypothetical protein [Acidiphilium sp. 34-64-41]|uniref:hypothetical protein n=2 Tax=unclassified Acidiphilium TaxID=2617493 RepID=UPI00257A0F2E|nr:hypothetical protein [Acidiphilium sp. 34-64-41]
MPRIPHPSEMAPAMSGVSGMAAPLPPADQGGNDEPRRAPATLAERLRKAINLALPPDRRYIGYLARVMGEPNFDRYRAVTNGTASLADPEIDSVAAMLGISPIWLRSGGGSPFLVGTMPLSDNPIGLVRFLAGIDSAGPWGPALSVVFVACAYPAYGSVLIICEHEGTALNPHRYSTIRTTTRLDTPEPGAWTWQPGALLLNMAFLSRLHVRHGGYRGQGLMSIIVSDDTYDALSSGTAHLRDLPLLISDSKWHLDLFDRQRLRDRALVFQHWQYWQTFGLWTLDHLAKDPVLKPCMEGYLRGDHPDFGQAAALLDAGPAQASTLTRTPYLQRHPDLVTAEPPPSGLLH